MIKTVFFLPSTSFFSSQALSSLITLGEGQGFAVKGLFKFRE